MKKTVISHFYNEEYLLPWWLNHHKQIFDQGIMINYQSTDNSVNIIKEICPDWKIIQSKNEYFGAEEIDKEVSEIEKEIEGWKICLNTTEFIIGNFSILEHSPTEHINLGGRATRVTTGYGIPVHVMIDNDRDNLPVYEKSLIEQKYYGMHYKEGGFNLRFGRLIHNSNNIEYPIGRHFDYTTEELVILWYGWSPFNTMSKQRKLQIQHRMPQSDKNRGFGTSHLVSDDVLENQYIKDFLPRSRDLTEDLKLLMGEK
jgi:hypothetical protein